MERSTSTTTIPAHLWSPCLYGFERPKPHILRLLVTERCNFRCPYCAPLKGFPKTPYRDLPSLDALARAAVEEYMLGKRPPDFMQSDNIMVSMGE